MVCCETVCELRMDDSECVVGWSTASIQEEQPSALKIRDGRRPSPTTVHASQTKPSTENGRTPGGPTKCLKSARPAPHCAVWDRLSRRWRQGRSLWPQPATPLFLPERRHHDSKPVSFRGVPGSTSTTMHNLSISEKCSIQHHSKTTTQYLPSLRDASTPLRRITLKLSVLIRRKVFQFPFLQLLLSNFS